MEHIKDQKVTYDPTTQREKFYENCELLIDVDTIYFVDCKFKNCIFSIDRDEVEKPSIIFQNCKAVGTLEWRIEKVKELRFQGNSSSEILMHIAPNVKCEVQKLVLSLLDLKRNNFLLIFLKDLYIKQLYLINIKSEGEFTILSTRENKLMYISMTNCNMHQFYLVPGYGRIEYLSIESTNINKLEIPLPCVIDEIVDWETNEVTLYAHPELKILDEAEDVKREELKSDMDIVNLLFSLVTPNIEVINLNRLYER